ncbi:tRNA (guanosine(37)-N1)-methyltransferase TrmD [Cohaesibacter celericrescens]|uniref:tRNA (guanine-N(1)-)-methyltransferase n=1 Tax=Cohaesibacter celericrescens TaxID=2067669 RepID=A0A2N5XPC5_9HYPH|nr:tRNA (guanosine(37)-N1)-methyltransferase TrmD [Cohaesibacter celericrescens]PLW76280.1 tRNA (guanosine(37)-N1)-methyltransferase TrmD [Cohaesibacter celericrescens]
MPQDNASYDDAETGDAAGWHATVLTLYPDMFPGPLGTSLAGRAMVKGLWSLDAVQIRDFAEGKHRNVDDTPAGGGAGMVLRPDVLARAIDHTTLEGDTRPRILLSPRGKPLTQKKVRQLKDAGGAVLLCGRFEGVDQRVIDGRDLEEISIGDYILSGGELGAMVLLDAVVRLLPGVMGKEASGEDESFESGLLEYPHYTRPSVWEDRPIPDILSSGHHGNIAKWRHQQAVALTGERRPDLYEAWAKTRKKP